MKRLTFFLLAALIAAMTATAASAQIKYVAVVETELDARSGASADLSAAEVALITAELRREAVKNLPRGKYNIMTSETVQAQGGAVLEECADENCVITLGSKIGADYIVRGIVSKFKTRLTLSVEMYETEDGTLAASSDPIRSENAAELLEKTSVACAEMYKTFVSTRSPAKKAPVTSAAYTVTAIANPKPRTAKAVPKPDAGVAKEPAAKNLSPLMLTARISGGALFVGGFAGGLLFNNSVADTYEKYKDWNSDGSDAQNPEKVKEMRDKIDSHETWRNVFYTMAGVGLAGFTVTIFF